MNKLILLLFSVCSFGQGSYLSMSPEIEPIMEEYIADGEKRGFYLRQLIIQKLDIIMFDETLGVDGDNRLGITSSKNKLILLSTTLLRNKILLKVTVYHELGHLIKTSGYHSCHQCYDIMSASAPKTILPYYNKAFLDTRIDEYFIWLNSN